MTRKNQCTRSHSLARAMATLAAAALVAVGPTACAHGGAGGAKDSVRWTKEGLAKLSRNQPKPVWQTVLQGQETDFIRFLSPDRVLVGTLETSGSGWGLAEKDLLLLSATTGETIWTAPRSSFGSRQTLLATAPVILLQGTKKIGALNPNDGTPLWERSWPQGRSLPLPDGNRIVLYSLKKSTLSLLAVNLSDGAASWSASAENDDPKARVVLLGAQAVGDVVLLSQERDTRVAETSMQRLPERVGGFPTVDVVAFADRSGQQLWRKNLGVAAAVVVLGGDDLYFMDAASITRADAASGNQLWRQEFPGATLRNLTVNGDSAYVLLKGGNDGSDVLQALQRQNGKLLWKCPLAESVQSPMVIEGHRIYVTTATHVLAVDASSKAILWRAAIPSNLQGRRLLPDDLRVVDDLIVMARENGVMGVQKRDGTLLFAESIKDGVPFTNDFATHTMAQAFESATPLKERPAVHETLASADATDMTSIMHQRLALQSQQASVFGNASRSLAAAGSQRAHEIHENMRLAEQGLGGPYSNPVGRSLALTDMYVNQITENVALVMAGAALGQSIGAAIMGGIVEGRISVMTAEVTQSLRTHTSSLQGDLYIRPRYQVSRGWSLTVINTKTRRRADILLTPDNEPLAQAAPNLPAFAIDATGSRIITKGIGLDPARYQRYEKRGVFDPTGGVLSFAGFIGEMWSIPYPSVLAFDLASLPSGDESEDRRPVAQPVSADRQALNEQLIAAAFQCDLATVKKSLDAGADVNATNEYGETAVMVAAESLPVYRKNDIVELLVQRGADVSIRSPQGWTATDYFAAIPSNAMVKVDKAVKLLGKEGKEESGR